VKTIRSGDDGIWRVVDDDGHTNLGNFDTRPQAEWFARTGHSLSAAEAAERMANMDHDQSYINAVRAAATQILQAATVDVPGLQWQWNNEYGGAAALPAESFTGANGDITKADVEAGLNTLGLLVAWLAQDGRGVLLQKLRTG
jgi:hypothetical protein